MPDLKEFYFHTIPNHENIERLYESSKDPATFNDKSKFMTFSNGCFGMLAHFNLLSTFSHKDRDLWEKRIDAEDFRDFRATLTYFKVLSYDRDSNEYLFNPKVTPLIERYRKIFDAFEQQNGLTSFYKQFE